MRIFTRIAVVSSLCLVMGLGGFFTSKLRVPYSGGGLVAAAGSERGNLAAADGPTADGDYRISALSIFSTVALHVKDNYVDPARIHPKEMLVSALNEIEREVPEVLVGDAGEGKVRIGVPGHERVFEVGDVESLWEVNLRLREIFRFLEKNMPPQKDPRSIEYAAVNGALSTLDPHSVLLKPEAFADMKTSTKGEFGGLGIVISVRDAKLTIMSPLDGTPASRAGLKALDVIERIGEVSTVSMPIEDAVRRLRGPEGSKVTIWVSRKSWTEARKFTLTREIIKIESVDGKLLSDSIGYVRVKNFQQNTGDDLEAMISKLQKENKTPLKGLVLDLRNNPGGLLEQAIRVSDTFLSSGDIVTTVGYGNKVREPKRAQWSGSDVDIPLAVVVNNGSASASEIVAGALKNQDRAVVVGERTFGKGSVQVLYDFPDSSALKLTIAQYLTPGNISIQNVGVAPDIALTPAWIDAELIRLYSKLDEHREDTLRKHLDRSEAPPEEAQPLASLTYLVEKKDVAPEDEGEEETEAETSYGGVREDLMIRFAKELLISAGRSKRTETLKAAEKFIATKSASEEEKITAAIQKLGIPWSKNPSPTPRSSTPLDQVSAKLVITQGAGPNGEVSAGNEVRVEATVTNNRATPLHLVRGELDTEHPAFRGRGEMLFGTLEPGATRTYSVKTKIPKEASSRSDIITLRLDSEEGAIADAPKLAFMTKYVPHPQFAYSFVVNDADRGDGDGLLERGEGVRFDVLITNVGEGNADEVGVRLKTGAGEDLFLEKGRAEVGTLASGETKVASLEFRVPEVIKETTLPVELTMWDGPTGEWLEDEIALTAVASAPSGISKKAGVGAAPASVPVYDAATKDAKVIASLPAGSVKYDASVGSFVRVPLLNGTTFGFVESSLVGAKKPKKTEDAVATFYPIRRAPEIRIDGQLGGRVVSGNSVELSGTVLARSLRDVYIVSNEEKLFYEVGPKAPSAAPSKEWTPPNDGLVSLPFKTTIPLEEGQNKIVIVARLDERVMSLRALFISRIDAAAAVPSAPAVAEAPGTPPTKTPN